MTSPVPTLKCQVKLHKEGRPIRPIVSFIRVPSYKLATVTSKILKEKYEFQEIFSINNSMELIQQLENIEINDDTNLITVVVRDMFTNIPQKKVIELIKENKNEGLST